MNFMCATPVRCKGVHVSLMISILIKTKLLEVKKTIKYIGDKLWNEIPEAIKLLPCLSLFKSNCKQFIVNKS